MSTLVIQSYKTLDAPGWIKRCLATVQCWSRLQNYDYRFVGDEIFELVPPWYMEKIKAKLPVATDYARLLLLQEAITTGGYERAIWFDADMLIFDQSLSLNFSGSCAFGQEIWVQSKPPKNTSAQAQISNNPGELPRKRYRATKNVHNAVCVFNKGCPVLPFLIYTVESIIKRVDENRISPQMVGPKLLGALHNIVDFTLLPQVGALSPDVLANINVGKGSALDLLKQKTSTPMQAANLCASLIENEIAEQSIHTLLKQKLL